MRATAPTAKEWTPQTLIVEILRAKLQCSYDSLGPWKLMISRTWDIYLNMPYNIDCYGSKTILQRILEINQITDVEYSDELRDLHFILVMVGDDE